MDNSNNPNSTNPFGTQTPPNPLPADTPSQPPTSSPLDLNPNPLPVQPSPFPQPPIQPTPTQPEVVPQPSISAAPPPQDPPPFDTSSSWQATPSTNPEPFPPLAGTSQVNEPVTSFDNPSSSMPTWPQTPVSPNPPSFDMNFPQNPSPIVGPEPTPQTPPSPTFPQSSGTSALDNPWGVPPQAPPLDGPNAQAPISEPTPDLTQTSPTQSGVTETAPTDLSHLISGDIPVAETPVSPATTSETLVVPSPQDVEVPSIPTETHSGGIPKWVIGLGIGLLIIIAGASAYFILGVGRPPQTTSIPATQVNTNQQIKPPAPIAQPSEQTASAPAATGSASFGNLSGASSSASPTSAIETLRQRQQQTR